MKLKSLCISILMLFIWAHTALASQPGTLYIRHTNQNITPYTLSNVQNITFDGSGNMLLHTTSGVTFIELAAIQNLFFNYEEELDVPETRAYRNGLNLYPVPVVNELYVSIETPGSNTVAIQIFDMSGKVVLHRQFSGSAGHQEFKLDVDNLAKGMYLCRVVIGETVLSQKFLK